MKTIDLGAVMMVPKGNWDTTVTYERNNLVKHNSAAWVCKVATSKGVEPTTNAADWYRLVEDSTGVSSVNGMTGEVTIDVTPNSHASKTTEFGIGTETEYGHLKLTNNVDATAAGVAISPSAVRQIKTALEAAIAVLTNNIGSIATNAGVAYDTAAAASSSIEDLNKTVSTLSTDIETVTDTAGNAINNLTVSGTVISFTRNNGTTGTISTQDTNTDTKVTNTLATTSKAYITGTTSNKTNTGTQVFDTGVYLTTTAGVLHADKIEAGAGTIWVV